MADKPKTAKLQTASVPTHNPFHLPKIREGTIDIRRDPKKRKLQKEQ